MKLHPLSVPYRVGKRAVSFGWAIVVGLAGASSALPGRWRLAAAALVVLALLALVGHEVAVHRRFAYALTASTLDISSGVLSRREREIPLGRVQNVDVSRNVVQRALGIATVNVETAGGGETEVVLECVSAAEADRLQTEIRRLKRAAAGETDASEAATGDGSRAGAAAGAPETVFELDDRHLLLASALSFDVRLASIGFVAQPFVWPFLADEFGGLGGALLAVAIAVGALAVVLALWAASAFRTFVRYYGFRLTRAGDDLRYERGLFQRYTGTIPIEKLQTVVVRETVLQRRFGYASLAVETAGYAPGSGPSGGSEAAVPLATRRQVLALARDLEPVGDLDLAPAPTRARRRYLGRYAILAGAAVALAAGVHYLVTPYPFWWLSLALVAVVPVAAHYRWRHLGRAVDGEHAVARRGFWTRRTHVVPIDRVQTVIERETLFQRRWGLASVVIDTAGSGGGDAAVVDVDAADAAGLVATVTAGLREHLVRRRG
ncbi:possibly related to ydbT [Halarchaeum acidiphilum MH1-52-1]|uniref:Possibly related to ydbT n=2 Tax=Halarchaeum acidiphilum TaxID=489138 RepID=U2YD38_9EURY|nr:PH domain-containing protein [Halarchaeum acidiphilum]GAD51566.1 possibly related to ydbT [Halarchaeum acidiphilum MH1-52-1]